jgi:hypothetical protein
MQLQPTAPASPCCACIWCLYTCWHASVACLHGGLGLGGLGLGGRGEFVTAAWRAAGSAGSAVGLL